MENTHFKLLESFGLYDGKYLVFSNHINRLIHSARAFDFTLPIINIKKDLLALAEEYTQGSYKVRLTVNYFGEFNIEMEPIEDISSVKYVSLAEKSVDSTYPYLYHKTTWRNIYNKRKIHDGSFDTLLWNERQELTEFTIGNLVVELNKNLYTPPIDSGLLNGTLRKSLIEKGAIKEKTLKIDKLHTFEKMWLINSVRGWIEVELIKNSPSH